MMTVSVHIRGYRQAMTVITKNVIDPVGISCVGQVFFTIVIISEVVSAYVHHLLQVAVVVVIELGILSGVCGGGHVAVVVIYIALAVVLHQLKVIDIYRVQLVLIEHIDVNRAVGTGGGGVSVVSHADPVGELPAGYALVERRVKPFWLGSIEDKRRGNAEFAPRLRSRSAGPAAEGVDVPLFSLHIDRLGKLWPAGNRGVDQSRLRIAGRGPYSAAGRSFRERPVIQLAVSCTLKA